MTRSECEELEDRLLRGDPKSPDVGSHIRKYQELCNEAAGAILELQKQVELKD